MKGILQFNLPEEREDFKIAQDALNYKCALEDVWDKIFRPYHKHGYSNQELQKLVEASPNFEKIHDHLRLIYREILDEYDISD